MVYRGSKSAGAWVALIDAELENIDKDAAEEESADVTKTRGLFMDNVERESIIEETIERMLKMLPEVVGNLMASNAMYSKLTEDFYKNNPDFINHKEIVREVISKIEGQDPTKRHEDVLKESVLIIKSQISAKGKVDMNTVDRKGLDLNFDESSDNGML
jgi:hypothetical protein